MLFLDAPLICDFLSSQANSLRFQELAKPWSRQKQLLPYKICFHTRENLHAKKQHPLHCLRFWENMEQLCVRESPES